MPNRSDTATGYQPNRSVGLTTWLLFITGNILYGLALRTKH